MRLVYYDVAKQGSYWAVRRHGKLGGVRLIAVYDSESVATCVASRLDLFRKDEP